MKRSILFARAGVLKCLEMNSCKQTWFRLVGLHLLLSSCAGFALTQVFWYYYSTVHCAGGWQAQEAGKLQFRVDAFVLQLLCRWTLCNSCHTDQISVNGTLHPVQMWDYHELIHLLWLKYHCVIIELSSWLRNYCLTDSRLYQAPWKNVHWNTHVTVCNSLTELITFLKLGDQFWIWLARVLYIFLDNYTSVEVNWCRSFVRLWR